MDFENGFLIQFFRIIHYARLIEQFQIEIFNLPESTISQTVESECNCVFQSIWELLWSTVWAVVQRAQTKFEFEKFQENVSNEI